MGNLRGRGRGRWPHRWPCANGWRVRAGSFGLSSSSTPNTVYTPGFGHRSNGVYSFYQTDWLGSTRSVTDINGATVASQSYEAWGSRDQLGQGSPNWPTDMQFAGGWGYQSEYSNLPNEPGLGLDYLQQRYYDPVVGRFMEPDPLGLAAGTNLFEYADDDPVDGADPDGLWAVVKANGNRLQIFIPIEWTGGTPAVRAAYARYIHQYWSGSIGSYSVTTTVVSPKMFPGTDPNHVLLLNRPPCIDYKNGIIDLADTGAVTGNWGQWYWKLDAKTVAHEAGHVMGLPDRYHWDPVAHKFVIDKVGRNSASGDIMTNEDWGIPQGYDIIDIIAANRNYKYSSVR